jgi:eukaryotic-like serine/threonine-protein kinase
MTTIDERQGTLFAGRYRLERKLGSGGMADVWLAEDTELGRHVAIKILHERYANDEQFVERFRREATHAAGLSHQSIVSIYDRGASNGSYYIVMEYVEGRTLKELILSRGPCPIPVAISYTRQILAALRYAHRNGIIHRDIKPHNVIVDREGRVKVADFGIARAGTSQMTEAGSIIGTAQYLSPEQARGAPVDESSDLYSTGVVLYELVTGTVPFTGETPVETAMKHLSAPPQPPSELRHEIPDDLDLVVLRALAKEPADRYRTAGEMDRDLELVARDEPVGQETANAATVVLAGAGTLEPTTATRIVRRTVDYGGAERYRAYDAAVARERAWWPWLLALGAVVALAVAAYFFYDYVADRLDEAEPVAVEQYTGLEEINAVNLIRGVGLEAKVIRLPNAETAKGIVFEQEPIEGTKLERDSIVVIRVSSGKPKVKVPTVVGSSRDEAVEVLARLGLDAKVVEVPSDREVGTVTGQDPKPNTILISGSQVRINVSKGPRQVAVPSVIGLLVDQATAQLQGAGFAVQRRDVEDDQPKDVVVAQLPDGLTLAAKGSTVTLTVSEGPTTSLVPDVETLLAADARSALQASGFKTRIVRQETDDPALEGVVITQDPTGGTQQKPGATITLFVGRFVEPPPATPEPPPPPPTDTAPTTEPTVP